MRVGLLSSFPGGNVQSLRFIAIVFALIGALLHDGSAFSQATFWRLVNIPERISISALAQDSNGTIYCGTNAPQIGISPPLYASMDGGETWKARNRGLPTNNGVTFLAVSASRYLFAGTNTGSVYRSAIDDTLWHQLLGPYDIGSPTSITINSRGTIFVGSGSPPAGGVFRTSDNGNSWQHFTAGIEDTSILALGVNSTDDIFAGTNTGGLYVSTDAGEHWARTDTLFRYINLLSILVTADDEMFVGTYNRGVFRSIDRGKTWTERNSGLANLIVGCLVGARDGVIYAGNQESVFKSSDRGNLWQPMDNGLTVDQATCFLLDKDDYLFAGFYSGKLYRSEKPVVASVRLEGTEIPTAFSLAQNYPNPFNPTTSVRYQLRLASNVRLGVYDILGREVAVLVNEKKPAGSYEIKIDGAGLTSGVYFCRFTAGNVIRARKMLLLR
jgi:photosystem II stability/assembly factor-like uncharacterized protein